MLNFRLLKAWPNWVVIPAMLIFWIYAGVLLSELLGASPYHEDS